MPTLRSLFGGAGLPTPAGGNTLISASLQLLPIADPTTGAVSYITGPNWLNSYAVADTSLTAAATLTGSEIAVINQGGSNVQVTEAQRAAFALKQELASVSVTGSVTLSFAAHNRRTLYANTSLTVIVPLSSVLGDGFECNIVMLGSATATVTGSLYGLTGVALTSLAAGTSTKIMSTAGAVYASSGGAGVAAPTLTLVSISGQTPGGTSTANLAFANGAPTSLTATLDGSALTIAGINISASGSGANASGTATFTFTTPAAGTHSIVATATGTYASSSNTYTLVTSTSPVMTVTSVSPLGAGITATAGLTFSNGAPTSLTATMDGSALTISAITITTTSGTGATAAGTATFTFTNPGVGSHNLVVTGTGTYASVAPSYGYSTASAAILVANITAPAPNTAFTVSGTYVNYNSAGLQYSTDNATWINSGATIAGGSFSFSISAGFAASGTAYTIYVRDVTYTSIVNPSNVFTITAAGGTITAPTAPTINIASSLPVTVTGSGNPTVYASITSGGTEQLPRVAVAFGATSVNLTPTVAASSTASLYAAATGGTALATSAAFTVGAAAAVPGQITNVVLGTPTDTRMPMTWTAPASGGNPTGFIVELSTNGGTSFGTPITVSGWDIYYQATGLTAATSYIARVTATNGTGSGTASANSAAVSTLASGAASIAFVSTAATMTAGTLFAPNFVIVGSPGYTTVTVRSLGTDSPGQNYIGLSTGTGSLSIQFPNNGTWTIRVYNQGGGTLLAESRPIVVTGQTSQNYVVGNYTLTVYPAIATTQARNILAFTSCTIKLTSTGAAVTANSGFVQNQSSSTASGGAGSGVDSAGFYRFLIDSCSNGTHAATNYIWFSPASTGYVTPLAGVAIP